MRSFFLILSISIITHHAYGMDAQYPQCPRAPFRAYQLSVPKSAAIGLNSANIDWVKDPRTTPGKCQSMRTPAVQPVFWCLEPAKAATLQEAISLPVEETGKVVAYLLTQLDFSKDFKNVDTTCLFRNAIFNRHTNAIITLINQFPELAHWELMDAVLGNKPKHLETLLMHGVNPNIGIGDLKKPVVAIEQQDEIQLVPGAQYPLHTAIWNGHSALVSLLLKHGASTRTITNTGHSPLDIALQGFNNQDDEAMTRNRLFILRKVLKNTEVIPTANTVQEKIEHLPKSTQTRIQTLLLDRLMPRACMSDDAPTAPMQQEKSSFACGASVLCCAWLTRVAMDLCVNWKKLNWQELKDDLKKNE